jgi:hypothetical protein
LRRSTERGRRLSRSSPDPRFLAGKSRENNL